MSNLQKISLSNILPFSITHDTDIISCAESIGNQLQKTTINIENVAIIPKIKGIVSNALLDNLAWQFHVDYYNSKMETDKKRKLVENSLPWHALKGTPAAVEEILRTIFIETIVSEWFEYGGTPYFFRVEAFTNEWITEDLLKEFITAIYVSKNVRSWLDYVIIKSSISGEIYYGGAIIADNTRAEISNRVLDEMDFDTEIFCKGFIKNDTVNATISNKIEGDGIFYTDIFCGTAIYEFSKIYL